MTLFLQNNIFKFSKKVVASALLIGGSLAWFFLLWNYLPSFYESFSPALSSFALLLFYGSAAASAILGIFLARRFDPKKYVLSWIILGVLSTISLAVFLGDFLSIFSAVFLGVSFGFALPTSLAFFAENTAPSERARVAGITILVTFVFVFLASVGSTALGLGYIGTILIIAVIRAFSLLAIHIDKEYLTKKTKVKNSSRLDPGYQNFMYYLIPWYIFHISADLALYLIPATSEFQTAYLVGNNIRFACIAVFGLITGFMADRFGRKQGVIVGLVSLGVGFAILSFMAPLNVIVYLIISGVAWGSLLAIYLVIPGDLAPLGVREKFYFLDILVPLILLGVFPLIPSLGFLAYVASPFSQILSVLLFLSVIPILFAKETLSESDSRSRKMKSYLKKVVKLVKDSKKS